MNHTVPDDMSLTEHQKELLLAAFSSAASGSGPETSKSGVIAPPRAYNSINSSMPRSTQSNSTSSALPSLTHGSSTNSSDQSQSQSRSNMAEVVGINPASTLLPQDPYNFDTSGLDLSFGDTLNDYNFGTDFDFNLDALPAEVPERPGLHDKRKVSQDSDSGSEEEGGGKRQEGDDKAPKKPGRKPVTAEPSTKRKAQNRAAQRAFRERKEKHLKDLETKVEELERTSEQSTQEKVALQSQLSRLQAEVNQYRRRFSMTAINASRSNSDHNGQPLRQARPSNDRPDAFTFDYPHANFGNQTTRNQWSPTEIPTVKRTTSDMAGSGMLDQSLMQPSNYLGSSMNVPMSMSPMEDQFAPRSLRQQSTRSSSNSYMTRRSPTSATVPSFTQGSLTLESPPSAPLMQASKPWDSPSVSSDSHLGQQSGSSYATTPADSHASPNENVSAPRTRKSTSNDASTIQPNMPFVDNAFTDYIPATGFNIPGDPQNQLPLTTDLLDPQLFGNYRESSEALITGPDFDNFLNGYDELPPPDDPLPTLPEDAHSVQVTDLTRKPTPPTYTQADVEKAEKPGSGYLEMNDLWKRLHSNECKEKNQDLDIDKLCMDLKAKAVCTYTGARFREEDVNEAVEKYTQSRPKRA